MLKKSLYVWECSKGNVTTTLDFKSFFSSIILRNIKINVTAKEKFVL